MLVNSPNGIITLILEFVEIDALPRLLAVNKNINNLLMNTGCFKYFLKFLKRKYNYKITDLKGCFEISPSSSVSFYLLRGLTVDEKLKKLYVCVERGQLEVVEYLINLPNAFTKINLNYALETASRCDHLDIVKYFVKLGADPCYEEAITAAAGRGHFEVVEYLVSLGAKITSAALVLAAEFGFDDVIDELVNLGVDPTADDNLAIQMAAENGNFDTVKHLITLGANPNAGNNYAMGCAEQYGHKEMEEYLASFQFGDQN